MRKILLSNCFLISSLFCLAQSVTILPSGITPVLNSSYPRLNYEEILSLPTPQNGDVAFDYSFDCLRIYNGNRWLCSYQSPMEPTPQAKGLVHGGNSYYGNTINDMETDGEGNIVVIGTFANGIDFGGVTLGSAGNTDIFIAKYAYDGSLIWAKRAGGNSVDRGRTLAIDQLGNIYAGGVVEGNVNFGGITASGGYEDGFLAKYDKNGNVLWVQLLGGTLTQEVYDLALDNFGNPHLAGFFQNTMTLGATSVVSSGQQDLFLANYDEDGNLKWVKSAGGAGQDFAWAIALDATGNAYITGRSSGSPSFGAISLSGLSAQGDSFIAKYNPMDDKWEFAKAGSVAGSSSNGKSIQVYQSNVYISGEFDSSVSYDGVSISSAGFQDIFLARLDLNGNIEWLKALGGTNTDGNDQMAIDLAGQIYLTGSFSGTTTFDGNSMTSHGDKDFYVASLSDFGEVIWLKTLGGSETDNGKAIDVDHQGNVFSAGSFRGKVMFGLTTFNADSETHFFISRMDK